MVITRWRVAFTERRLSRPRTPEPLLDVLGDLDAWLDEHGVLDGRPARHGAVPRGGPQKNRAK
jgi:hypothetical protein